MPENSRRFYSVYTGSVDPFPLHGLNFSPYLDRQSPDRRFQVSRQQIVDRLRLLVGYCDWIRTFGMIDGQEVAGQVGHQLGFQVALGAWLGPEPAQEATNRENIDNLIAAGQANEAELLIVGSEALHRGDIDPGVLVDYIEEVRLAVPGIPVTTADTYAALIANPNVIAACDLLMANFYPFFERSSIDCALPNMHRRYGELKLAAGDKEIRVSETGWPSGGQTLGDAEPTPGNAVRYFREFVTWARANSVRFFYFNAFDEAWKTRHEGRIGAHWGVWDADGQIKPGMSAIFQNESLPADWNDLIGGAGTPSIEFTSVPALGTNDEFVSGTVSHVRPFDVYVITYIKVGDLWWTKPFFDHPLTPICNGVWTARFRTHANDAGATEIAAFVIPKEYPFVVQPYGLGAIPQGVIDNALASATAMR